MIIFVDIDETICHSDSPFYANSTPIQENINKINKLYHNGHTIIYWTARGASTGENGAWFKLTLEQLKQWGCNYNELRMGKPLYDLLICDKAKRIEDI